VIEASAWPSCCAVAHVPLLKGGAGPRREHPHWKVSTVLQRLGLLRPLPREQHVDQLHGHLDLPALVRFWRGQTRCRSIKSRESAGVAM
jgi:hypothetical protein